MYVAACPRCVESYGVIPHTYIRTVGGGSNGTTARRAVSYKRIVTAAPYRQARATPIRSHRREAEAPAHLVSDVDRQQDRRERLHSDGVAQRSAVERTQ